MGELEEEIIIYSIPDSSCGWRLESGGHHEDILRPCVMDLTGTRTRSEAGLGQKDMSGHGSDPTWVVPGPSPTQDRE